MAERALDAQGPEPALAVGHARHAHHRVEPQERHDGGGAAQVDLAGLKRIDERLGERIHIDLETDRQRRLGADAVEAKVGRGHAAQRAALDGLVQPERAAPEILVAESVEAESAAAFFDHPCGVAHDRIAMVAVLGGAERPARVERGGCSLRARVCSEKSDEPGQDEVGGEDVAERGGLQDVLRLAVVAQDGAGDAVEALVVPPHHRREEGFSAARPIQQQGDHLAGCLRAFRLERLHRETSGLHTTK